MMAGRIMRKDNIVRNVKNVAYFIFGLLILFGGPAFSETNPPQIRVEELGVSFWFRAVLSGMLAILIWVAKGADNRIRDLEKFAIDSAKLDVDLKARILLAEKKIELSEHEHKQMLSMISLQRELMLTRYHDKDETEKHRLHVEESLRIIASRLDSFVRPSHRYEDDKGRPT